MGRKDPYASSVFSDPEFGEWYEEMQTESRRVAQEIAQDAKRTASQITAQAKEDAVRFQDQWKNEDLQGKIQMAFDNAVIEQQRRRW